MACMYTIAKRGTSSISCGAAVTPVPQLTGECHAQITSILHSQANLRIGQARRRLIGAGIRGLGVGSRGFVHDRIVFLNRETIRMLLYSYTLSMDPR
jgi:hypothetical protein